MVRRENRFAVLTPEQANAQETACHIRYEVEARVLEVIGAGAGTTIGGVRIVDPLWDPEPGALRASVPLVSHPYGVKELTEMREALASLVKTASVVEQRVGELIEQTK